MKGIIFILLEERIVEDHGHDAWDEILERAGVEGVYTTLGNYPYEAFLDLLQAAEPYTGTSGRDAQRWFGRHALHTFTQEHPHLFEPHDSTISFTKDLNEVIHPEVRKLYPEAPVPTFEVDEDPDEGDLLISYKSSRGLCSFAEGLIDGTADLYQEAVHIEQPACVHEGDDHCEILIRTHTVDPKLDTH